MGFRFSRRIKIAPGVRLNLGLRGVSVSAGVRGANMTLGRHGLHGNVGLPGTGLSYRTKLAGGRKPAVRAREAEVPAPETITLRFDGRAMMLLDERSRALAPAQAEAARRLHRQAIGDALRARAEALNAAEREHLDVHLQTPPPQPGSRPFDDPKPQPPAGGSAAPSWGDHMQALSGWRARKAEHERSRPPADPSDLAAERLAARLGALAWPRETEVSFELADRGRSLRLDVDLPEFEDMPSTEVHADLRGLLLEERPLTEAAQRRAYVRHVHAVVFRLAGEAFAALDGIDRVLVAGYTQRVSPASGREIDDYILDGDIPRQAWCAIDFSALDAVDPVTALAALGVHRDLTRRNELQSVPPPPWAAA